MDLKTRLGFDNAKTGYIAGGLTLLVVLLAGMQMQTPVAGGEQVEVSLLVDTGENIFEERVSVANNSSVFDALNQSFEVEYQEYSMGFFVTSIRNVSMDENHSWLYFVNGEVASKAVNNYLVSDGDNITFRYLNNSEASSYFE